MEEDCFVVEKPNVSPADGSNKRQREEGGPEPEEKRKKMDSHGVIAMQCECIKQLNLQVQQGVEALREANEKLKAAAQREQILKSMLVNQPQQPQQQASVVLTKPITMAYEYSWKAVELNSPQLVALYGFSAGQILWFSQIVGRENVLPFLHYYRHKPTDKEMAEKFATTEENIVELVKRVGQRDANRLFVASLKPASGVGYFFACYPFGGSFLHCVHCVTSHCVIDYRFGEEVDQKWLEKYKPTGVKIDSTYGKRMVNKFAITTKLVHRGPVKEIAHLAQCLLALTNLDLASKNPVLEDCPIVQLAPRTAKPQPAPPYQPPQNQIILVEKLVIPEADNKTQPEEEKQLVTIKGERRIGEEFDWPAIKANHPNCMKNFGFTGEQILRIADNLSIPKGNVYLQCFLYFARHQPSGRVLGEHFGMLATSVRNVPTYFTTQHSQRLFDYSTSDCQPGDEERFYAIHWYQEAKKFIHCLHAKQDERCVEFRLMDSVVQIAEWSARCTTAATNEFSMYMVRMRSKFALLKSPRYQRMQTLVNTIRSLLALTNLDILFKNPLPIHPLLVRCQKLLVDINDDNNTKEEEEEDGNEEEDYDSEIGEEEEEEKRSDEEEEEEMEKLEPEKGYSWEELSGVNCLEQYGFKEEAIRELSDILPEARILYFLRHYVHYESTAEMARRFGLEDSSARGYRSLCGRRYASHLFARSQPGLPATSYTYAIYPMAGKFLHCMHCAVTQRCVDFQLKQSGERDTQYEQLKAPCQWKEAPNFSRRLAKFALWEKYRSCYEHCIEYTARCLLALVNFDMYYDNPA
jgi:hypothetical protein